MAKRFKTVTEQDLIELQQEKDSKNTQRAVLRAVRLFSEFLTANGDTELSINELSKDKQQLNEKLRMFYASVRRVDGVNLKKKSLDLLKYGVSKHLKEKCGVDISDPDFVSSHDTYKAKVKQLKKTGFGSVQHKPVIGDSDLGKLNSPDCTAFNIETPCGLQNKVWFDIMYFLIRRGRENLRAMTKSTYEVSADSDGNLFVHQVIDEADKNHGADATPDDTIGEGKMYARPGDPKCPVKCFEKYLSKLHPEMNALWQRPLESFREDDTVWYYKSPMGQNTLGQMMSKISKLGKLSKVYTNHCLRATAISNLDAGGFEARHIMRASGHKGESSIRSYSARLSESKQREMSECLSKPFIKDSAKENVDTTNNLNKQDLLNIFSVENDFSEIPPLQENNSLLSVQPVIDLPFSELLPLQENSAMFSAQPLTYLPVVSQDKNITQASVPNQSSSVMPVNLPVNTYQQENIHQNFRQQIRQSAPIYNITNCEVHFHNN